MTGATVIFVGPTLPAAEVSRRLPGAEVRGPVAVGDVLRLARRRGIARIAIIDGYFERMAAVWHKEILVALARGIAVWGAASMGALRAAELAPFGMIGVGTIYRAFAAGRLVADDEVAVAHLPAEYAYAATSDALVDLRDGLAKAKVTARTRDALIALARGRFYRERSWAQLIADGRDAGLPQRQLDAVAAWRAAHPMRSRKSDDARLLLRRLASARPRTGPRIAVPRTWALRQLEADLAR